MKYYNKVTDGFSLTPREGYIAISDDEYREALDISGALIRVRYEYPFKFAPHQALTLEELSLIEKQWRDSELSIYVDHFQKPLVWGDLTEAEKAKVADYRRLLLDYPASEEFKTQTRPERSDVPPLK